MRQLLNCLRETLVLLLCERRCLLCAHASAAAWPLCASCLSDLPALPNPCQQCASPLPAGADYCESCANANPPADSVVAAYRYAFPLDKLIHALKFEGKFEVLAALECALRAVFADAVFDVDCVVPMPLHPKRQRERGFNQAQLIGQIISQLARKPLREDLLRRVRMSVPQSRLDAAGRHSNVFGAFEASAKVRGMRLLLVDDVMTSGATVRAAASALYACDAHSVHVVVLARAGA